MFKTARTELTASQVRERCQRQVSADRNVYDLSNVKPG